MIIINLRIKQKIQLLFLPGIYFSSLLFALNAFCDIRFEQEFYVGNRLSYIEAKDNKNETRLSQTKLQMVSQKKEERSATITAFKEIANANWSKDEPIWAGLETASGLYSVKVFTAITGIETAKAGDNSKMITIEIFSPDKEEFTFAGMNTVNKISLFSEKLASTFSLSARGKEGKELSVSASREWVDKYADPNIAHKIDITLTGTTPRFKASGAVQGYSLNLPLIKIGLFLNADVGARADMSYTYDPSKPLVDGLTTIGSVTADGSIGAELKAIDLKGSLDYRIYSGATFTIPAEVSANFISTDKENPGLSSTGSVGPAKVEAKVKIQISTFEWVFDGGEFVVVEKQLLW